MKVFRYKVLFVDEDDDENNWLKAYDVEMSSDGLPVSEFIRDKFSYSHEYLNNLEVLPTGIEDKYIDPESVKRVESKERISSFIQGSIGKKEKEIMKDLRPETSKWYIDMIYDSFIDKEKRDEEPILSDEEKTFILEKDDESFSLFAPNSRDIVDIPEKLEEIIAYPSGFEDLVDYKQWNYPPNVVDFDSAIENLRWQFDKIEIKNIGKDYVEFVWYND